MKTKFIIIIALLSLFMICNIAVVKTYAIEDNSTFDNVEIYSIYDDNFQLLFQKDNVVVGDGYLSEDYKYYEVVFVDQDSKKGIAKFIEEKTRPNVGFSKYPKPIKIEDRVICLYMTHNDESYLPSDGVDSVYGNGGIKDVAMALKKQLERHFIDVYLDDTLHIPHDTSAYSRSYKTAKSLMDKHSPDAIFDIHRDATRRSFYVTNVNGKERGRVRMVIGKANPNMKINEEFALYLMAVANEVYPWLFTDIFYASGHYNQNLDGKAILFECGSHLVEKELEIETMYELADVINTALFNTTVNENTGDLTINGVENNENKLVNEILEEKHSRSISIWAVCIGIVMIAVVCTYVFVILLKNVRNIQEQRSIKIDKS